MQHFLFIFINVILPIFIQIILGFIIQRKFKLNISTLAKIQFYIFIPALLFMKLYTAQIDLNLAFSIVGIVLLVFFSLYIITMVMSRIFNFPKKTRSTLLNSVCLYNSGNYCIPLIELLYPLAPLALSIQIIIMTTQSIMTNTFGVFYANLGNKDVKKALLNTLKLTMLYTILAAIILRSLDAPLWSPIGSSLTIIGQGMIPLALFTLGAQLAETKISLKVPKVYLSNFLRLIIAPTLAYLFIIIFNMSGLAAQVIIISSAAPSAVNSVLLAIEYDNEPELASEMVFMSTLLSAFTVTGVIYLATNFI